MITIQNSEANYFKTSDNEQIFYIKNFNTFDESRPLLLFNYGLVCSNHHWKYQLDFFEKLNYQIVLHDYRGHFQSSGSNDIKKMTFKQMSHDIGSLCDFLGIKKAIVLGHSMGVNICLQMASDYPNLISGMVLISGTFLNVRDIMFNTNIMEFIAPLAYSGLEKYPEIFRKIWSSSGSNPIVREIIHSTGFNKQKVSKEFIEIYLNRVGQLGADIFFQLYNEMTLQNLSGEFDKMKMPSLIIGGMKDNVIPNHLQRTLANLLPKSETYFLKDGSHVPQADYPELINERIELFLKKIEKQCTYESLVERG